MILQHDIREDDIVFQYTTVGLQKPSLSIVKKLILSDWVGHVVIEFHQYLLWRLYVTLRWVSFPPPPNSITSARRRDRVSKHEPRCCQFSFSHFSSGSASLEPRQDTLLSSWPGKLCHVSILTGFESDHLHKGREAVQSE